MGRHKIRRPHDKAKLTVIVVSAALLISLVAAIALFTDVFANAFPIPVMIESLVWVAGLVVRFGIVNLLTLSRRWRKPVAGTIVLACGLLFAGLFWLLWTFFNSPSILEWEIQVARNLPEYTPQSRTDYGIQAVYGLTFGVFFAALNRFFQKPWDEEPKRREAQLSLLAIGIGLTIIILVYVLSEG
jgi:hypothetical protein